MDYCGPRGIAHEKFLTWSKSSRDKAIWWMLRDRQKCSSCGTRPDEWDPDKGGDRRAYRVTISDCEGCILTERASASDLMKEGRGKKIYLIRNT